MSAATTTAAPLAPASVPAGRAAFPEVLRAELIRSRRTFTWRSVLVTVLLAAWAINLARILLGAGLVSDSGRWAGNVLAWLSFYPTATALPVGALVGAMHEWREQRVRGGGTWWRAVPQAQVLAARCLVIAASASDRYVVDGAVEGLAKGTAGLGQLVRRSETGNVRSYASYMMIGSVLALVAVLASRF